MSSKQSSPPVQKKKPGRDFRERDEWERDELLSAVWCDNCNDGNLGVLNPSEYEIKGVIYLEGTCAECGESVVTKIEID